MASPPAFLECSRNAIPAQVVVQLQQVFQGILIVSVDSYPLAALSRRVDGVQSDGDLTLKVAPERLIREPQRLPGPLGRRAIVVVPTGFRVGACCLHRIGAPVYKEVKVRANDFVQSLDGHG